MRVRVPASTANLGPGFDSLALALSPVIEVSVEIAESFSISTEGYGAGLFDDENHLAARIVREVLGHSRFAVSVKSEIPLARGLGSSASLALAAAAAAGSLNPLAVAVAVDGHAENAAASLMGGLVAVAVDAGEPVVSQFPLDEKYRFVVVVPEEPLATATARSVLPEQVTLGDAIFNISRIGPLLAGLGDHTRMRPGLLHDRLHQSYRSSLLTFSDPILSAMVESGALGACWSGAGSSMLGLATIDSADEIRRTAQRILDEYSVEGSVWVLEADRTGLVTQ